MRYRTLRKRFLLGLLPLVLLLIGTLVTLQRGTVSGLLGSAATPQLTADPDAVSWAAGRVDVFARAGDNTLWHQFSDGGVWSAAESMGGSLTSGPGVASWGPNRLDVFVKGGNEGLYQRFWNGAAWGDWAALGAANEISSDPAAVSWGPNRIDVFARAKNDGLWHIFWNGSAWSEPENLGGSLIGGPAVASWGSGRLDVFVHGGGHALYHKAFRGGKWDEWESLGGTLTSDPAAVSWGPDRIDVFGRAADNSLAHIVYDQGKWSAWETLGGSLLGSPAVATQGAGKLDVFVRGSDSTPHQRSWNGSQWGAWAKVPAGAPAAPTGPATVTLASGNNQQAIRQLIPGTNLGPATFQPLKVAVTIGGVPTAGVPVVFNCNGGGLSCQLGVQANGLAAVTQTITSDGTGIATLPAVTAGTTSAGNVQVTATAGTNTVAFTLTVADNVARGKYVRQSSTVTHPCFPVASKAVDGNTDGNWPSCTIASTDQEQGAWWQVDLLGTYNVGSVVVWNRTDCCADRLSNFTVKVSTDGATWTTAANVPGVAAATTVLPMSQTARWVRVPLNGNNHLSLTEVQVAGVQLPGTPTIPMPDLSYVTDLTVVAGGNNAIRCPGEFKKIDQDLNEGAGGDFIYACVKHGVRADALTRIRVLDTPGAATSNSNGLCTNRDGSPGEIIPVDLNKGAGGWNLYFCKTRAPGSPNYPELAPVSGFQFDTPDIQPVIGSGKQMCSFGAGWRMIGASSMDPGHSGQVGDLNRSSGGKYIYGCIRQDVSP